MTALTGAKPGVGNGQLGGRARPRWGALVAVAIGTYMLMLDLSVVSIALPQIHQSLKASFTELQWVFDAYALTLAVFLIVSGVLADSWGRRRFYVLGLGIFSVSSLACGLAGTAVTLSICRGLQGAGASILFAVGPAILGEEFHGKARGVAFTVFGIATGLAVATGPLVGGALTSGVSWRWIFFINVPLGIAAMGVTLRSIKETKRPRSMSPDWAGLITFTVSLSSLVMVIIRSNEDGWVSPRQLVLVALSAAAAVVFLLVERRAGERALMQVDMFVNRTFSGLSVVTFIANLAAIPAIFLETNYMENVLGASAWIAGLRFLPLTLALLVAGGVTGAAIAKVSPRFVMGLSCILIGVGLLLGLKATTSSDWTAMLPSLVVMGAGMGMFNPLRASMAISILEPRRSAFASGVNETFQQVGVAVGIAAIGSYFQDRIGASLSSASAMIGGKAAVGNASAAISAGALKAPSSYPSAVAKAYHQVAANAFVVGFHDAFVLGGVISLVAGVIALGSLRSRDLYYGSLASIPPEEADGEPETALAGV